MSREKLAHIVKVTEKIDIEGKDRIKCLKFEGMGFTIIGDNSYEIGEEVVFIEAETILPQRPEFEFLRKRCFSEKYNGFKIKPMKMGGIVSYGICFKQEELRSLIGTFNKVGTDVTKQIGVLSIDDIEEALSSGTNLPSRSKGKWRYRISKFFNNLKNKWYGLDYSTVFPGHILGRTDETRIENMNYIFLTYKDRKYEITEKCDGSSITLVLDNDTIILATRNRIIYKAEVSKAEKLFSKDWPDIVKFLQTAGKVAGDMDRDAIKWLKNLGISNFMKIALTAKRRHKVECKKFAMQGELCGPGIQKNKLELKEPRVYIFNMCFPDNKKGDHIRYFSYDSMRGLWHSMQEIKIDFDLVPFVKQGWFTFTTVDELKELAKGAYLNTKNPREGIVIRFPDTDDTYIDIPGRDMSNQASFKCINSDFLLVKDN